MPLNLSINWDACQHYILSRQTIEGGFCFYRAYGVEESNPLDVYSAVMALGCLQAEIPRREALIAWLRAQQNASGGYASLPIAWYVLEALRLLGAAPAYAPYPYLQAKRDQYVSRLQGDRPLDWSAVLLASKRLTCLLRNWSIPTTAEFNAAIIKLLHRLHGSHGGYGWPRENLIDTAAAAAIHMGLALNGLPQGLALAAACGDAQTGFRLVPDSSSTSLEAVYAGVSLFKLGQQRLPEAITSACLRFISSCQSANGGFGRTSSAIPTLADTRLALDSLQQLSRPAA